MLRTKPQKLLAFGLAVVHVAMGVKSHGDDIEFTSLGLSRTVAISPDGTMIAIALYEATVLNAKTKKVYWKEPEGKNMGAAAFSPDSKYLFAGLDGGGVTQYDIRGNKVIRRFDGPRVATVEVSSDGSLLAATDDHGDFVRIWDIKTGEKRCEFKLKNGSIYSPHCVHFDPASNLVACTWSNERTVGTWEAKTGKPMLSREIATGMSAWELQWLPTPNTLAVGDSFGDLHVIDLTGKTKEQVLKGAHRHEISAMAISSDRKTLITSGDSLIRFWNTDDWSNFAAYKVGGKVTTIAMDGIDLQFAFRMERGGTYHGFVPKKPSTPPSE